MFIKEHKDGRILSVTVAIKRDDRTEGLLSDATEKQGVRETKLEIYIRIYM